MNAQGCDMCEMSQARVACYAAMDRLTEEQRERGQGLATLVLRV